ncbi:MAG: helix-turn-helix transcriptional regulator [Oscillospiraceae bacterium]|nr:helix-turn-helix transcriptional regulator [Oscillospiraceae bacterium]
MINTALLRRTITEKHTCVADVAEKMGIDKATLYRRIADGKTFTIGEVGKITEILNLSHSESIAIFFSQPVA